MARESMENHKVRKLGTIGASSHQSYYVTLPVELVREFGWREGQKLVVRQLKNQRKFVIEDWKK